MSRFSPSCFRLLLFAAGLMVVSPSARAQTAATPAAPTSPSASPIPGASPKSNGFVPPNLREKPPVAYPELAHLNRAEGVVRVTLSIDEAGNVTKAIVTRPSGSLMIDAVVNDYNLHRWKFDPATVDGVPVPSTKDQEFEFRLDPAEEKAIALKRLALPVGTPDAPYPKEAVPLKLRGSVTIGVRWTKLGLVNLIYILKPSGFPFLDHTALRWAYENWHIDPATLTEKNKDDEFSKTMNFVPPP